MCRCKNIEVGSYENQITLPRPPHMNGHKEGSENENLCLDACIAAEVRGLWRKGIITTGCCCGHNKQPPYIGVIESQIPEMKALGYQVQPNHLDLTREDGFKPKTV